MDGRGDHGERVAIIGVACRFPGARDPAEFHDLAVTGRRMFQPVRALPGRPLRAAMLDDWAVPQVTQSDWPYGGLAGRSRTWTGPIWSEPAWYRRARGRLTWGRATWDWVIWDWVIWDWVIWDWVIWGRCRSWPPR
jgi:hypothetical protein